MRPDSLKEKLNGRGLDQEQKELLKKEYRYFSSIAPTRLLSRLFENYPSPRHILLLLFFLILPPVAVLGLIAIVVIDAVRQRNPVYKGYDYTQKIVGPMLRLFDEKLTPLYHPDSADLTDTDIPYVNALVGAHMIRPVEKGYHTNCLSVCSYDWDDPSDTDSFEFADGEIYYEWRDDDGDYHRKTYFEGSLYKFHTSFTTRGEINIMSTTTRNILGAEKEKNVFKRIKDRDLSVIDTENHEFAENFDTVVTYDDEAYQYLTPTMIEALLELRKQCFFCICIKGNVMTVTIDKGGYKQAAGTVFGEVRKPVDAPKDPEADLEQRLSLCHDALLSIYELKDILDPGGKAR